MDSIFADDTLALQSSKSVNAKVYREEYFYSGGFVKSIT